VPDAPPLAALAAGASSRIGRPAGPAFGREANWGASFRGGAGCAVSAAAKLDSPGGDGFVFLFGTTRPFDDATLARLYPGGHAEHVRRFDQATARAVEQGFLLEADAEEIRALAHHGRQPSGWRHG